MVFFITFLRALAACLITNAHYTGIYPTDIIANGGLIGDVLFFAVSGYCLYNVKYELSLVGFGRWYGKRIWRVYPPVLIATFVYMLIGAYQLSADRGIVWWYLYPTYYHFVASIIILYIPFFFIMKIDWLKKRLVPIMIVIGIAWIIVYFTVYDRSYYHIDTVREPMIRFLFMESMLLGAWFRQKDNKLRNRHKPLYLILTVFLFILYFASKVLFAKRIGIAPFQFLNQIVIFVLLYYIFRTFCGLDEKIERFPVWMKKAISFIANMTLEIYIVQYVIINKVKEWGILFPLNWLVITMCIVASAFVLHTVCSLIYRSIEKYSGGG